MLNINKETFEEKEVYQIVHIDGCEEEEFFPYFFNTQKAALNVLIDNEGIEKRRFDFDDDWYIEIDWRYEEEELRAYDENNRYLKEFYSVIKTTIYI